MVPGTLFFGRALLALPRQLGARHLVFSAKTALWKGVGGRLCSPVSYLWGCFLVAREGNLVPGTPFSALVFDSITVGKMVPGTRHPSAP